MPKRISLDDIFIGWPFRKQLTYIPSLAADVETLLPMMQGLDVSQHIRTRPFDSLVQTLKERGFTL